MVLDTSALAAILFGEPEQDRFIEAVVSAPRVVISSGTLLEASLVVEARRGEAAGRELDNFLHRARVETVAVDADQVETARTAWRRYGKGRHVAGLSFGDLFAYALARATGDVLLYKGDDFSSTDIASALD